MTTPPALVVYEQIADAYAEKADTSPYNAYCERPAMLELIGSMRGLNVLELGCGYGYYLSAALSAGAAQVIGIDASVRMCELARERTHGAADVRCADIGAPFEDVADASIELVLSPLALHYLRDWTSVFNEVRRVLRDEHRVVFSVSHPMTDFQASKTGSYFDVECIEEEWPSYGIVMPTFRRSFSGMLDAVRDSGFRLERVLEPRPIPALRLLDPELFETFGKRPPFLCVSAIKG